MRNSVILLMALVLVSGAAVTSEAQPSVLGGVSVACSGTTRRSSGAVRWCPGASPCRLAATRASKASWRWPHIIGTRDICGRRQAGHRHRAVLYAFQSPASRVRAFASAGVAVVHFDRSSHDEDSCRRTWRIPGRRSAGSKRLVAHRTGVRDRGRRHRRIRRQGVVASGIPVDVDRRRFPIAIHRDGADLASFELALQSNGACGATGDRSVIDLHMLRTTTEVKGLLLFKIAWIANSPTRQCRLSPTTNWTTSSR